MYENHFNLNERPFRNVPDTKMFYDGGGRGDILRSLKYAIESGEGIVKVVGEVGSGKTMLCRKLDESLSKNIQVVFLANPSLEPEYILHAVAKELGLDVTQTTNRYTVQQELQSYLVEQHEQKKRVVVLIEEAQCMPPRTLEEIRLMSNLETEKQKLLQLVLFGQPELNTLLDRSDLRQFNERISYALHLKSFTLEEHREYLNHRLSIAGYHGEELFNEKVVKHIYKFAKGSVRRINLLADKTLLSAYAHNDRTINIKHARSAAEDSKYIERVNTATPLKIALFASLTLIVILTIVLNMKIFTTDNTVDEKLKHSITSNQDAINNNLDKQQTMQSEEIFSLTEIDNESINSDSNKTINNEHDSSQDTIETNTSLSAIRVKETEKWLKIANRSDYTIQLMTAFVKNASELYALEDILKNNVTEEEASNFFVFHGKSKNISVYIVCFQVYPSFISAKNAINTLPSILTRYKPFLRDIQSILSEIGDNNA